MLNDFIGGGQVFLHKVRMFVQVFNRSFHISILIGVAVAISFNYSSIKRLNWDGIISYRKSTTALAFDEAMNFIRAQIGNKPNHVTYINAKYGNKLWKNIDPYKIERMGIFKQANDKALVLLKTILLHGVNVIAGCFIVIFILWNRFGLNLKADKRKEGSGVVLSADRVRSILRSLGKCSGFYIGKMPLVKDTETRHFLVTGATGSGKTNLIHTMLTQVERKKQAAIVIDQTGEMIAKYYNPSRGDIIFNPLDARSGIWDFWDDCSNSIETERFSKILIGFNRKASSAHSDPFWENAAMSVFNGCIESLREENASIEEIIELVCNADVSYLRALLNGTEAARYLGGQAKQTTESILAVLTANAKPLTYLRDANQGITEDNRFSMKRYFKQIEQKKNAWLFLATKPGNRDLTLPLIACMTELALSGLMEIGIDKNRRIWISIDELPALGKLPALSSIMSEGRKYGACVIAGMQSLNQLYEHYGQYSGSSIFGQFGTAFFFRNNEPEIAKVVSSICGNETITRQQKNTSFGADTHRDGVSYSEQVQKKALVEPEDLASLAVGECYAILPDPAVRVAQIQTDEVKYIAKQSGFVPRKEVSRLKRASRTEVNDGNPIGEALNETNSNDGLASSSSTAIEERPKTKSKNNKEIEI